MVVITDGEDNISNIRYYIYLYINVYIYLQLKTYTETTQETTGFIINYNWNRITVGLYRGAN